MSDLDDALELRIVLYDELAVAYPRLLPDAKYAKLSKDPKMKGEAARLAFTYLSRLAVGRPVTTDLRLLLCMWCMIQLDQIRVNKRRRGRPTDYSKKGAIRAAYARKAAIAKPGQKESIVAELAEEFALKRRRVFEIIEDTDDLVLRAFNNPDLGRD